MASSSRRWRPSCPIPIAHFEKHGLALERSGRCSIAQEGVRHLNASNGDEAMRKLGRSWPRCWRRMRTRLISTRKLFARLDQLYGELAPAAGWIASILSAPDAAHKAWCEPEAKLPEAAKVRLRAYNAGSRR